MAIKHTIRTKDGLVEKPLTRASAIKYHCLECSGFNAKEVRQCPVRNCAVWPFRTGGVDKEFIDAEEEVVEESGE